MNDFTSYEHRIASALELVATALDKIAQILAHELELRYPAKKLPRDAIITHIETDEERLQRDLEGDTTETLERWTDIGEREARFPGDSD